MLHHMKAKVIKKKVFILFFSEFAADFKFVILVAGFKSLCKPHLKYYDLKVNLPSLHIIGDTDNVIVKGKIISESIFELKLVR